MKFKKGRFAVSRCGDAALKREACDRFHRNFFQISTFEVSRWQWPSHGGALPHRKPSSPIPSSLSLSSGSRFCFSFSISMWQVLLAAAAAGSTGLVAKHIWSSGANPNDTSVTEKSKECDESCGDQEEPDDILKFEAPIDTKLESPMVSNGLNATANEGIFRFSSSGSRGATSSRLGSKNLRKKTRSRWRGAGKEAGGKNFEAGNCARELVMEQKRSSGRFSICLKKRRTNKNLGSAKSQSSCSSSGKIMMIT